jgi:hypothetical protein
MKVLPHSLEGSQDYGNCVAWMERELTSVLTGMAVAAGELKRFSVRHGTAYVYSMRGSMSQGMVVADAHDVVMTHGQSEEKDYGGGIDLSTEDKDESSGNKWGRSGPPDALVKAVSGDTVQKAWLIETLSKDVVCDVLWNRGVIATGSTRTAAGPCDPVCSGLDRIGGHAQAFLGYDDSDEFRDTYKKATGKTIGSDEFVVFMDQSWGSDWIKMSNWFTDLWGPRPEGMVAMLYRDFADLAGNRYGEAWGLTGVNGFVANNLPDWGSWTYL